MADRRWTNRSGAEWRVDAVHGGPQGLEDANGTRTICSDAQHVLLFLVRCRRRRARRTVRAGRAVGRAALKILYVRGRHA